MKLLPSLNYGRLHTASSDHFRFFFQMHSPMCTHPCALTVSLLMTPANFTAKIIGFGLTAQ